MFDMAFEKAMRLREMYTLEMGQISLEKRTIFLHKTKNGSKRQVPISSVLFKLLEPLYPWVLAARFVKAGYPDLHFGPARKAAQSAQLSVSRH